MRDGYLRGAFSRPATPRQLDVLAAYVAAGGSVPAAAAPEPEDLEIDEDFLRRVREA